jgi:hypothetical protein
MKLTKNKAKKLFVAFKNGLSMALAFVLLVHAGQPIQVLAASFETPLASAVETQATAEPAPPAEATEEPPTVQDVLLRVCTERGYGQDCAKHLLGMLWKESNNIATAVGDRGKARGYFQIHYRLHKVSVECAEDLECSAGWTLDYLERNHYPKYVAYAVQCHNGCDIDNGYAASALRHGRRLWTQPLPVVTAEALRLARQ